MTTSWCCFPLHNRFKPSSKIDPEFRAATGLRICDCTERKQIKLKQVILSCHESENDSWTQMSQVMDYTASSKTTSTLAQYHVQRWIKIQYRCHRWSDLCLALPSWTSSVHYSYGGGGSVMVWSSITYTIKSCSTEQRVTGVYYHDEVLHPVLPFCHSVGVNFELRHQNAPLHTSHVSRNLLMQNNIKSVTMAIRKSRS
jgi:hypothetical protein